MTCAHVVNVSLKKVPGVDSVEVSLNQGLAKVKLKPGNEVTVPQLWHTIHNQGYTPKVTLVVMRGDLASLQGQLQLKVSGANTAVTLTSDPKDPRGFEEVRKYVGQQVIIRGAMTPAKDLKSAVPLQVAGLTPLNQKGQ